MPDVSSEVSAKRDNQGKLSWSLLWIPAIEEMVKVLMFGASRYGRSNWKRKHIKSEVLDSMMRHLAALMDGQELDTGVKGSGLHHTGHIMCNCMFYFYGHLNGFAPERKADSE